jgi:protein-S-isoprenylcysteine O-methyltransferase Ste14
MPTPRDLRKYANSTTKHLVIGAMVLLFVVGLGLIALFYGMSAAWMGLLCILGGFAIIGLVYGIMVLIGLIAKKYNGD